MTNSDSENQALISRDNWTFNEQFTPVDRVIQRHRYRRIGFGVVFACCLGLGLSLAIALPLVNNNSSGTEGNAEGGDVLQVQSRLMMKNADLPEAERDHHPSTERPQWVPSETHSTTKHQNFPDSWSRNHTHSTWRPTWLPWWWNYTHTTVRPSWQPWWWNTNHTTARPSWLPWWWNHTHTTARPSWQPWWWNNTSTTTHSTTRPTWRPWWWNYTHLTVQPTQPSKWNITTASPSNSTTRHTTSWISTQTVTTTPVSTTTADWLPEFCPRVPRNVRSRVDVSDVISVPIWFEQFRIQTYNAPAYADGIACSTMQLNSSSPYTAEAHLTWEQGRINYRERKSVKLYLRRNDTASEDWLEAVNDINSTELNQFSFLARVDDFLLAYECFQNVDWWPKPAYVIHVYSASSRVNRSERRIAELLIYLAELWGLNPEEVSPFRVRQRYCDVDIGHA